MSMAAAATPNSASSPAAALGGSHHAIGQAHQLGQRLDGHPVTFEFAGTRLAVAVVDESAVRRVAGECVEDVLLCLSDATIHAPIIPLGWGRGDSEGCHLWARSF